MSGGEFRDELWPHFVPLWTDLQAMTPRILITGGYGLFLKQQWLVSQLRFLGLERGGALLTERGEKLIVDEVRTVVPIHHWKAQTPRVTKDFDFIAALDLIASPEEQRRLDQVLKKHDFNVVEANARWQFEKKVGDVRFVILDFHSPSPPEKWDGLRVQARRVKPRRSLGHGIHGRENAEAVGSELHPFSFTYDDVEILLPNPVTLSMMKLVAMRDRRNASQDAEKPVSERNTEEAQARKHAEDVCRVIAMMTREESKTAAEVLGAVCTSGVYLVAREIFGEFFGDKNGWGTRAVAEMWREEDFNQIQNTLATWFR